MMCLVFVYVLFYTGRLVVLRDLFPYTSREDVLRLFSAYQLAGPSLRFISQRGTWVRVPDIGCVMPENTRHWLASAA